jgi:hypothetical protein
MARRKIDRAASGSETQISQGEWSLRTSIAGKLENTALPVSHPLAPLYEAVHNAMQAIEDAGDGSHEITITIERLAELLEEGVARPTGFVIRDTGIGFDDDNSRSFFTAESRYKADKGGKGNGRFLWLKAFDHVAVDSHFNDSDGKLRRRNFVFDRREDQDVPDSIPPVSDAIGSTVTLTGMNEKLSKLLSRALEWYADRIIAHFLPYFRRANCAHISINDGAAPMVLNE